jgi:hypothetical protein
MPQASDKQRARWGLSDSKATQFLEQHGYKLMPDFLWVAPSDREPTEQELDAIQFLVDEWDFGGICEVKDLAKRAARVGLRLTTRDTYYVLLNASDVPVSQGTLNTIARYPLLHLNTEGSMFD